MEQNVFEIIRLTPPTSLFLTAETVLATMQAGIDGIRSTGAKNLITVPGNAYTGAHSWLQNYYGTPNSEVMIKIKDPQNNFVFEMHQYLGALFSDFQLNLTSPPPPYLYSYFSPNTHRRRFLWHIAHLHLWHRWFRAA